jgi:hypothetical protein
VGGREIGRRGVSDGRKGSENMQIWESGNLGIYVFQEPRNLGMLSKKYKFPDSQIPILHIPIFP